MNNLLNINGAEILSKDAQKQVLGGFGDVGIFENCDSNDPGIGDLCFLHMPNNCAQNQVCVPYDSVKGLCGCGLGEGLGG